MTKEDALGLVDEILILPMIEVRNEKIRCEQICAVEEPLGEDSESEAYIVAKRKLNKAEAKYSQTSELQSIIWIKLVNSILPNVVYPEAKEEQEALKKHASDMALEFMESSDYQGPELFEEWGLEDLIHEALVFISSSDVDYYGYPWQAGKQESEASKKKLRIEQTISALKGYRKQLIKEYSNNCYQFTRNANSNVVEDIIGLGWDQKLFDLGIFVNSKGRPFKDKKELYLSIYQRLRNK